MELSAIGAGVYAAEAILRKKIVNRKAVYEIKWKGYSTKDNTWEPEENILDKRLLDAFNKSQARAGRGKKPLERTKKFKEGPSTSKAAADSTQSKDDEDQDEDEADEVDDKLLSPTTSDSSSASETSIDTNAHDSPAKQEAKTCEPSTSNTSKVSSANPLKRRAADAALYLGLTPSNKVSKTNLDSKKDASKLSIKPKSTVNTSAASNEVHNKSEPSSQSLPESSSILNGEPSKARVASEVEPKLPAKTPVDSTTNGYENGVGGSQESMEGSLPPVVSSTPKPSDSASNGPSSTSTPIHHKTMRRSSPPPEVWKKQTKLADKILITDVTSNNMTITVRECSTALGFFKEATPVVKKTPIPVASLDNKQQANNRPKLSNTSIPA